MSPEWKNNFLTLSLMTWQRGDTPMTASSAPHAGGGAQPRASDTPGRSRSHQPRSLAALRVLLKTSSSNGGCNTWTPEGKVPVSQTCSSTQWLFFGKRNARFRSMKTCWGQSCCTAAVRRQCAGGIRCIFLCQILRKVSSTFWIMAKKKPCKENF